ncbi:hypothetical protein BRD18_08920 [Halobacteriales archaeon SW_7_71_33]|nr:MAG: hypothetical protein BRD18_08920 [Halobacteriales archaeon SW_7_71_33]
MRLTRRDALAALAGVGAASAAGCSTPEADGDTALDETVTATLVAAADVLYPAAVEGTEEFVRTYARRRTRDDRRRREGVETAIADLDGAARAWYGDAFRALSAERRDAVLREVSADTADPDPSLDGAPAGRVRYYVVNELLYALYTSPAGGRLVGVENPVGHPGGTTSYRQGPR